MSERHDQRSPSPALDYASPPPEDSRAAPPRLALLLWCALPAAMGASSMTVALYQIAAAPAAPELSATLVGSIVVAMLLSLLTSGALLLATFEARKSPASVVMMLLNLAWFAACAAWFVIVRFKFD